MYTESSIPGPYNVPFSDLVAASAVIFSRRRTTLASRVFSSERWLAASTRIESSSSEMCGRVVPT